MTFRNALLAATLLALPLAAKAQPVTGLYVGAGAGVNILMDEDVSNSGASAKSHVGPAGVVSLGWGFGNGLRAEVEGNYRYNPFSGVSGAPAVTNFGGNEQKFGGMVNVLYDFNGFVPYVTPYVGAGVGYEWAMDQNLHYTAFGQNFSGATKTEGAFAYQAIVGAALPIAAAPGLALTAEYRFLGMTGDRTYGTTGGNLKFNEEYNHSVLLGVRYNFGQAPAPIAAPIAAPAPAVAPARSYLVFFDWDKATLTDRARQIISEAAANSTKVQYTKIEVNGYTDTSGTPKYNQGLSVRRAQAVAAELVKDGVPKAAISIQGFGDTHLLVPTGAGVREPQNRRVEIIIR
ncbi:MAG: OmpA family protein [Acetobacteraceae bacterium]|nr:OmpA family protein [Acetobacteraceae bacterium]